MKLSEITESFDSKIPYKVVIASNESFNTKAEIGGRTIFFTANITEDGTDNNPTYPWEIEFQEISKNSNTYSKTGSGHEMQVFAFIIDSIKELIARYSPDEIVFGSEKYDSNRTSLYKRMANKIKLPGYHLASIVSGSRADRFSIVRDDKT